MFNADLTIFFFIWLADDLNISEINILQSNLEELLFVLTNLLIGLL